MHKKAWCARAEVLVVYHWRDVFAKSGWKVNGKWLFWVIPVENFREQRKISKWSLFFFGRDVPNANSCSISSEPTLIPVSGFRGSFSVNGTDFLQMVNAIPGGKYQSWILITIYPNCEPISLPMWVVNNRCLANLNLSLFCCSHWRRRAVKQSKAGKIFFF